MSNDIICSLKNNERLSFLAYPWTLDLGLAC